MIVQSCTELLALAEKNLRDCPFPPAHPLENDAWKSTFIIHPQAQNDLEGIREQCTKPLLALDREISNLEEQILDLQKQIYEVTSCVQSLKEQKAQQEARITRLDCINAPHKKLPAEVLSHIFELANEQSTYYISGTWSGHDRCFTGKTRDNFPEQVCAFWRQVSLKTPTLYNRVWVNYNYANGPRHGDAITELAQQVIARGTRHLTIHLGRLLPPKSQEYFAKLVLPRGQGLEKLSAFHCNATQEIMGSYASLLLSLPNLEVFEEHFQNDEEWLDLCYNLPRDIPSNFWGQLTKFDGGGIDSECYMTIQTSHYMLSRCPQLEACYIRISHDNNTTDPFTPGNGQICLSNLSFLEFRVHEEAMPNVVPLFLRPLVLPLLKKLRIIPSETSETILDLRIETITALLERSKCKLSAFRLEQQMLSEGELMALLPNLSTVEELSLANTFLPPSVSQRVASGHYLPELRGLEVKTLITRSAIDDIVALAHSRWGNKCGADITQLQCWYEWVERLEMPLLSQELSDTFRSQNRFIRISEEDDEDGLIIA